MSLVVRTIASVGTLINTVAARRLVAETQGETTFSNARGTRGGRDRGRGGFGGGRRREVLRQHFWGVFCRGGMQASGRQEEFWPARRDASASRRCGRQGPPCPQRRMRKRNIGGAKELQVDRHGRRDLDIEMGCGLTTHRGSGRREKISVAVVAGGPSRGDRQEGPGCRHAAEARLGWSAGDETPAPTTVTVARQTRPRYGGLPRWRADKVAVAVTGGEMSMGRRQQWGSVATRRLFLVLCGGW